MHFYSMRSILMHFTYFLVTYTYGPPIKVMKLHQNIILIFLNVDSETKDIEVLYFLSY